MKNTIISYANLSNDLKVAFREWLGARTRELVSFPFHGKHMKGYFFSHHEQKYLVIMQLHTEKAINTSLEGTNNLDINEEF